MTVVLIIGLALLAVELVAIGRALVTGARRGRQRALDLRKRQQIDLLRAEAEQRIIRIAQDSVQAMLQLAHDRKRADDDR